MTSYYQGGNSPLFKPLTDFIDDVGSKWDDLFNGGGVHRKYWDASYYIEDAKDYEQFSDQKFAAGFFPPLEWYHKAKDADAYQKHLMDLYGIDFEDMKYPWLTNLGQSSTGTAQLVSGGARHLMISKNITKLYR